MRNHFIAGHPRSATQAVTPWTIDNFGHLWHKHRHASVNIAHQLTPAWSLRGPVLLRVRPILLRRSKMFSPLPKKSNQPVVHARRQGVAGSAVVPTGHAFPLSKRIA